jgi:DNA-directed RNA polymerase specialized sigma24 family protein
MSKKLTTPLENGDNPYIKCSTEGVICMDRKGFDLFCGKLYGDRNPDEYRGLRENIKRVIRDYDMEVDVKEIIGHICEVALCMATSKEGWYVDNHIAYLTTVARNRVIKMKKYHATHRCTDIELCHEFMAPGDAFKSSEDSEIIEKSLEILKKRHRNDYLFIEGLKMGHFKNEDLARHLNRENDAKFRKAKQRALDRMREIVLEVMSRGPDGIGMPIKADKLYHIPFKQTGRSIHRFYNRNQNHLGFSFLNHSMIKTNIFHVNAHNADSLLLTFILHMEYRLNRMDLLNVNGFRTSTERLRDVA